MTINRLLKDTTLPPDEVKRLNVAFEAALTSLFLVDRSDPITDVVARKVIEICQRSRSMDPLLVAAAAVKELGVNPP